MSRIIAHDSAIFVDQDDKTLDKVIEDLKNNSSEEINYYIRASKTEDFQYTGFENIYSLNKLTQFLNIFLNLASSYTVQQNISNIINNKLKVNIALIDDVTNLTAEFLYGIYKYVVDTTSASPIQELEGKNIKLLYDQGDLPYIEVYVSDVVLKNSTGGEGAIVNDILSYDGFDINNYEIDGLKITANIEDFPPIKYNFDYMYKMTKEKGEIKKEKVARIFKNNQELYMKIENDDNTYLIGRNTHSE